MAALSLLLLGLCLSATPEVDRTSLRYGFSPRIKRYSWASLKCRIVNPDSDSRELEIRFVDSYRGAVGHKNIFTEKVHAPPMTVFNYSTPVMSEDSEEYRLEVFVDGTLGKRSDSFIVSVIAGDLEYISVLNDHEEASLGAFANDPRFKGSYTATNFSAKDPPETWELLKKSACVVMVRPDFSRYSSEAFQAILDYVCQGGHVFFAHPRGAADAYDTPLAVLLPVVPLRFREISELKSLTDRYPGFSEFNGMVPFLETLPYGDGITMLEHNGMPVFRWKKFGLGTSRFSAFPVTADALGREWLDIFEFSIYVPRISGELSAAVTALDEMAGFVVPGVEKLRIIFLIFFILVAVPIGLGIYFKRTAAAWFATSLVTIAYSAYILKTAASGHSQEMGIFLSFIETAVHGPSASPGDGPSLSPGDGLYGIFSTSDRKLSIGSPLSGALFSSIPPPDNIMAMFQQAGDSPFSSGQAFTPPTEIINNNGVSQIKDMSLNSNASRQFYVSFNSLTNEYFDLPQLSYENDGFKLAPWTIPGGFNPEDAWLQFPNGIVPLEISGGSISLPSTPKKQTLDPTTLAVQNCARDAWRRGSPFIMMAQSSQESNISLPGEATSNGKRLSIIPLRERAGSNTITLPHQSVLISAGDTSTRMIMIGNDFIRGQLARSDSEYIIRFQLPPLFSNLMPQSIAIELNALNEGANLTFTPVLMKGSLMENKFIAEKEKVGKLERGRYVFSDIAGFIHNGTGFVNLKVALKRTTLPMEEVLRANTWTMQSFNVYITGSMPENIASFEF